MFSGFQLVAKARHRSFIQGTRYRNKEARVTKGKTQLCCRIVCKYSRLQGTLPLLLKNLFFCRPIAFDDTGFLAVLKSL